MRNIEGSTETKGKKEKKKQTREELESYINEIRKEHQDFLSKTFEGWYGEETAKKIEEEPLILSPEDIDFEKLSKEPDAKKFGEYTVNSDMAAYSEAQFEKMEKEGKIKVLDLAEFQGKPLHEVGQHLVDTYGDTHHIPGIEFWQWVVENPHLAPTALKDGNYHLFFGSLVRSSDGNWVVPNAYWYDAGFRRNAYALDSEWEPTDRVVLLEK